MLNSTLADKTAEFDRTLSLAQGAAQALSADLERTSRELGATQAELLDTQTRLQVCFVLFWLCFLACFRDVV
jgi:cytosine/uracil/thiamine/allantoin permease